MKCKILKRLAALALCCAAATTFALAASTITRTITVEYSGIKLVVDGVPVTPKDANGSTVEPFVYNGTTYLPVRAVGNAIGKEVNWDGASQTVYLGEMPNARNWLMTVCPPYETHQFDDPASFKMAGQNYTHGFLLGVPHGWGETYALFNLNGKYSTLSVDIGHVDGMSMGDASFEIYLDGELSQILELDAEDLVTHYDIPLRNALQLKIYSTKANVTQFGFANAELK